MSVFTRREIQERLNTFSRIVGKRKLNQIVKLLNIEGNKSNNKRILESLAVTWEVVVVSAFCESGDTKYEMKISNGKTPDFFFCDHGVSLIGDVVTVSDDQQNKKNPVEDFSRIIGEIWREFGPKKGSLSWRVESIDLEPPSAPKSSVTFMGPFHLSSRLRPINRGSLTRLLLPPLDDLSAYLHSKVCPFFKKLSSCPDRPDSLDIDEQYDPETKVRFSIRYTPAGHNFSGSYPSYTTITDIDRHVLWRRLIEKREQFAHATEEFPRILFICDGGCAALRDSSASASEYRFHEVLDHFWRRPEYSEDRGYFSTIEEDISAVVGLSIESSWALFRFPNRTEYTLKAQLYLNPYCRFPLDGKSAELLNKVVSKIPVPIETPENVLRSVSSNPTSSRQLGVFTMSAKHVEMSAVALLRILSGELSAEEFCHEYQFDFNPFKNALMKFQTIKSVRLEPATNRDDDKIVIEFGTYDAAIGPFRVPDGYKERNPR